MLTGQLAKPPFNLPEKVTVAAALREVTTQVADRKFAELNISPEMQNQMKGFRRNDVRSLLMYRARNMDGIWATAPYLHNNSVPNLYQLLLPASQRAKSFYVGNLQYDPKVLGFVTTKSADAFELRTNIAGNSNAGHEFREGKRGKGIIDRCSRMKNAGRSSVSEDTVGFFKRPAALGHDQPGLLVYAAPILHRRLDQAQLQSSRVHRRKVVCKTSPGWLRSGPPVLRLPPAA